MEDAERFRLLGTYRMPCFCYSRTRFSTRPSACWSSADGAMPRSPGPSASPPGSACRASALGPAHRPLLPSPQAAPPTLDLSHFFSFFA
jgi:hypothetical protein